MASKPGSGKTGGGSRPGGRSTADMPRQEAHRTLADIEKNYVEAGMDRHQKQVLNPLQEEIAGLREQMRTNPGRETDRKMNTAERKLNRERDRVTPEKLRGEFTTGLGKKFNTRIDKNSSLGEAMDRIIGKVKTLTNPYREIVKAARELR